MAKESEEHKIDDLDKYRPKRAPMPMATPFVMDAEAEIRKNIERHFGMVTEIEQLRTDRDHWRQRAELAEVDVDRMVDRLKVAEQRAAELQEIITILRTQFETSAQAWLSSYRTLREATNIKVVVPQELAAIEASKQD